MQYLAIANKSAIVAVRFSLLAAWLGLWLPTITNK